MIRICTDSLSDLPQDVIEHNDIGIAPVYVVFSNERIFRHNIDISTEEICAYYKDKGAIPGIAAPSIQDLIEFFDSYISVGDEVLFISMASGLSPTYKNALAAAKKFTVGKVTVMDSSSVSSGTAMMILRAVAATKTRKNTLMITQELKLSRKNLEEEIILDRLNYRSNGGNIYGLHNKIKSPLNISSASTVRTGRLHKYYSVDDSQRGTLNSLDKMLYNTLKNKTKIDRNLVLISQTMAEQPAEYLKNAIIQEMECDVLVTPSISGFLSRTSLRSISTSYYRKLDR